MWNQFVAVLHYLIPAAVWVAFWLLAVNWKKAGPVLYVGGWAPFVLLALISAGVWSRLDPVSCNCLKFVTLPNFVWQLGAVGGLVGSALFCGWLQDYMGWTPPEYAV